ncbi:MAG: NusG domain II-containing protein [Christensenellaceae bacterium]|nr:NusG domain II-containing protein [Christensenellaceae bacterium]
MERKNWLIPLLIAIAAAALLLISQALRPLAEESVVIITVDGVEYDRVPLSQPRTVTVEQPDGEVNVIEVSGRGAVMLSSSCRNQLCVHMGEVTVDNWEFRPNQAFIICLPNRVSVELVVVEP